MADDAVTVAPDHCKTILENGRVRLLEYRGGPGAKTAMHSHPDIIAYPPTAGKFRFSFPDGKSMEIDVKAGEPMFMEGHSHSTENMGTTDAHILLVELK